MKMDYIVSRTEASQDGSPYVYVTYSNPNEVLFLVVATATVYTHSVFAINATGIKGGTPCAHSGDVGQRNPVNITTMTIFVCDD